MTRAAEPRAESSNTPPEVVCTLCGRRYTDDVRHVETDVHLEAMADEDIHEWLALPLGDPDAVAFAKQIARLEFFAGDYRGWYTAMNLPDTPETLVTNRRLAWIAIKAIGVPDYERRMSYARKVIEMEQGVLNVRQ